MIRQRKPIRRVSLKKQKLDREYRKLKTQFLIDYPWCQHWLAEHGYKESDVSEGYVSGFYGKGCKVLPVPVPRSTEIHHTKGRGKHYLDTSTWMATRPNHSLFIHNDPKTSYAKGYMKPRR